MINDIIMEDQLLFTDEEREESLELLRRLRQLLYFFSWDAAQQAFRRRQGRWR